MSARASRRTRFVRWLARLFWLAAICGAGFAVWTALRRRSAPAAVAPVPPRPVAPSPAPPPAPVAETPADEPAVAPVASAPAEDPAPTSDAPASDTTDDAEQAPAWLPPIDGACPDGYPIKAAKSGIYHVPGGRSYERTVAQRCYSSTDAAEADGYRRAKA